MGTSPRPLRPRIGCEAVGFTQQGGRAGWPVMSSGLHVMSCTRGGGRVRSGNAAAPGAAGLLSLAATPTFAVLALWSAFFSGQPDMLCGTMENASPLNGMALMYALMSVFHAAAWLKLVRGRSGGALRPARGGHSPGRTIP